MNLKDKVVIVTGAGSGIGKATAKLFGAHGARVVVSDIDQKNAKAVADEILLSDGKASVVKTDVTQFNEVESLVNWM